MQFISAGHAPRLILTAAAASALAFAAAGPAFAQLEPPPFEVPEYEGVEDLPTIQLRMTDINSPAADSSMTAKAFIEYVDRASGGKIEVEVFWSSALMSFGESGRGIASGLADMGLVLPLYTPADFPVNNHLNQLSMLTDDGFPGAWLAVSGAVAEFLATNEDIRRELHDFGIEPVGGNGTGGYDTLCNKPWNDLESAQGLRTRAAGQSFALQAQALGMVPVPTTATEVYEAFSRGILDCVILQPNSFVSLGVTSVPGDKYWVNVPLTSFNGSVFMFNKDKWDSLPPVAQQILTDAYVMYSSLQPVVTAHDFRKFGDLIRSGDIEPMQVEDEVVQTIEEHNAARLEDLRQNAPEGVSDPEAFVAEYQALVEKWQGIVEELGYPSDRLDVSIDDYVDSWYTDYDFTPFAERLREELAKAE